ncbi:peptide ABC transporter substrate-binding protein [Lutispora sp.]|uniref:peptide ABC transporter substrate-binding protein n=1 Tax=Lutispora sp. TaxID=2828727 RepID=UPI0035634791
MKNLRKLTAIFLIMTMVIVTLAGCAKPAPATSEVPAEEEQPAEETISDSILVWNIGSEPQSWDPQVCGTTEGGNIINTLFEGLMMDTKDGLKLAAAESYEIGPNAEGVENTVYTFKLRPDGKWSDGKPVTAHDFEYAWKKLCLPEAAATYAFLITDYVVGAQEFYDGEGELEDIKINALDDYTLQVELKAPVPYFLSLTSFMAFMPSREDIAEQGEGWEKSPETCISNGPFKLTEYQIGSHLSFEKNEHYWDAENVKLKGIKGLFITEDTTALQGYRAGEIQVLSAVPQGEIPKLASEDPNFYSEPSLGCSFYTFNVDVPPTNDVNVRKALSLAIDRKMIVEQVLRGGEIPASGYVPSSFSLSDGSSFRKLDSNGRVTEEYEIDPWNVNVEKAKEYLAKAGYPDGKGFPKIELLHDVNENQKKLAEAIQQMWKQNLGIEVELRAEERSVFFSNRYNGKFVVARGGWTGDYNDPMTMFDLFTSVGINYSQWRWQPYEDRADDTVMNPANKEYEDLLKKAMTSTGKERDEYLLKAEQIFMDEAVVAPIYYNVNNYIIDGAKVENVQKNPMGYWIFKHATMID